MRSPLLLLSCALLFAVACDPSGRHKDRVRSVASKDLKCAADKLQIEQLERLTSNSCYAATYRVRGCGEERQYKCAQRNSADPCRFWCDPIAAAPVTPVPPGPGPGGIVSHQCDGRPCQQTEPIDPVEVDPTWHHRAETCWIKGSGASQPADVDMMLYVVGLNHHGVEKPNDPTKAVDREGVKRLADVIAAWPHPERVVIVSSSFTPDCLPTSGKCLEEELEARTKQPFELSEVIAFPPYLPTIGVISGSRWKPVSVQQRFPPSNSGSAIAEVHLRDTVTQVVVPVYALHTKDGDAGLDEIKTAAFLGKQASQGRVTPIIAGDFNMTETTQGARYASTRNAAFFRANFEWINDKVTCPSKPGSPDYVFHTQDGNKMHALLGRLSSTDPTAEPQYLFTCAPHYLERVSMSYSVDLKGRLANPPPERGTGPSWQQGIALYDIAHNVLAFGLRLKQNTVAPCAAPLRAGARCDNQTGCSACTCAAGLSCQLGAGGRSFCRDCSGEQACSDRCTAQAESCRSSCTPQMGPSCLQSCNRQSARCHATCQKGGCN